MLSRIVMLAVILIAGATSTLSQYNTQSAILYTSEGDTIRAAISRWQGPKTPDSINGILPDGTRRTFLPRDLLAFDLDSGRRYKSAWVITSTLPFVIKQLSDLDSSVINRRRFLELVYLGNRVSLYYDYEHRDRFFYSWDYVKMHEMPYNIYEVGWWRATTDDDYQLILEKLACHYDLAMLSMKAAKVKYTREQLYNYFEKLNGLKPQFSCYGGKMRIAREGFVETGYLIFSGVMTHFNQGPGGTPGDRTLHEYGMGLSFGYGRTYPFRKLKDRIALQPELSATVVPGRATPDPDLVSINNLRRGNSTLLNANAVLLATWDIWKKGWFRPRLSLGPQYTFTFGVPYAYNTQNLEGLGGNNALIKRHHLSPHLRISFPGLKTGNIALGGVWNNNAIYIRNTWTRASIYYLAISLNIK